MAVSVRTTRVLGALAISGVLIAVSFVISSPNFSLAFLTTKIANAASTTALLQAYAQKDSDHDGLPDWEEALYGTDPNNPHSISPTLTDGQEVAQGLIKAKFTAAATAPIASTSPQDIEDSIPGQLPADGTLTQQFSQDFFESYVNTVGNNQTSGDDGTDDSNGTPISSTDEQSLINQMLTEFSQKAQVLLQSNYTLVDVHTDSTISISDYAGSVEQIIVKHDVSSADGADPVALMQAYIENSDPSAEGKLVALAASYSGIATDLSSLSVPPSLASDHLELMQSFDELAKATNAVSNFQKDPAVTLGAVGIYQPASQLLVKAMNDIANAILATGEPAPGEPGAIIVNFARMYKSS